MTGLADNATYQKIKVVANHVQAAGPDTTKRWEEQFGKSPSSIAAEIAGLVLPRRRRFWERSTRAG